MYENLEFVICAAGECTRNFPHSKAIAHKSLLPMGDKRIIDYTLKDIVQMGAKHITIVCSNKKVINENIINNKNLDFKWVEQYQATNEDEKEKEIRHDSKWKDK